jgi:undecaprenyl-diphosphatase
VDPEDLKITRDMQRDDSGFLIYAGRIVSYLSTPKYLRVLVVPLGLLLWIKGLRLEAIITIGVNWTSEIAKLVIKRLVGRPRPSPALVHVWKSRHHKSFPSGNVVAASTFWGWLSFLGLVYWRGKPAWQKALLGFPLLLLALVGPSRVYLGDHWTTDVLGGYLLGNGWLGFWLRLYLLLRERRSSANSSGLIQ